MYFLQTRVSYWHIIFWFLHFTPCVYLNLIYCIVLHYKWTFLKCCSKRDCTSWVGELWLYTISDRCIINIRSVPWLVFIQKSFQLGILKAELLLRNSWIMRACNSITQLILGLINQLKWVPFFKQIFQKVFKH
jgi:hypothetical protein